MPEFWAGHGSLVDPAYGITAYARQISVRDRERRFVVDHEWSTEDHHSRTEGGAPNRVVDGQPADGLHRHGDSGCDVRQIRERREREGRIRRPVIMSDVVKDHSHAEPFEPCRLCNSVVRSHVVAHDEQIVSRLLGPA